MQDNEEILDSLFGHKILVKHGNDILFYGMADTTTARKLDDWPEDIDILPADEAHYTLKDVLLNLMGKKVKLGAHDGVGFIYCGEVKSGLLPWLDKKSAQVYEAICANLNKIKANIANFESDYYPLYLKKTGYWMSPMPKDLDERLRNHAFALLQSQEKKYEDKKKRFTKLLASPVEEMYMSISPDEENVLIILFEGMILNSINFWTIKECEIAPHVNWEIDVLTNTRREA